MRNVNFSTQVDWYIRQLATHLLSRQVTVEDFIAPPERKSSLQITGNLPVTDKEINEIIILDYNSDPQNCKRIICTDDINESDW